MYEDGVCCSSRGQQGPRGGGSGAGFGRSIKSGYRRLLLNRTQPPPSSTCCPLLTPLPHSLHQRALKSEDSPSSVGQTLLVHLYDHGGIFPTYPSHWLKRQALSPTLSVSCSVQALIPTSPRWLRLLEPRFPEVTREDFSIFLSCQVAPMNLSSLSTRGVFLTYRSQAKASNSCGSWAGG